MLYKKIDWLTHVKNGDGTATLSGTPTNAEVGSRSVRLLVTDADDAFSDQEFEILVQSPPIYEIFQALIRR